MIRVLIGLQSAKQTEATSFLLAKVTDTGLGANITNIESSAVDGNEWSEESVVSAGTITGTTTFEVTRAMLDLLIKGAGFDLTSNTTDLVYDTQDIAQYGYYTIVQEYTDDTGNAYHRKFLDVKASDITLNLNTDSYVQAVLTPLSEASGTIIAGAFAGTVTADTEKTLIVKSSTLTIAGTDLVCETTTMSVDLNNNLTSTRVLCGSDKAQKNGNRSIQIDYSMPSLDATEFKTEYDKSTAGTAVVVNIVLSNIDGETVTLAIPKALYSSVNETGLTGTAGSDRTLMAKWDSTQSPATAMTITFDGMGV